jgi:hypothetical protein
VLGAGLAVVLAGALTGCGGGEKAPTTSGDAGSGAAGSPSPAGSPAVTPGPGEASLPPGDPGLDAPAMPDPGTAAADPHAHEEVRRTVPMRAMLTTADLRMAVGGRWERHAGANAECVVPQDAVATRTMAYGGTSAGMVLQTVASYPDTDESDAAVFALREAVEGCGWGDVRDPRIGSAAVAAVDGARAMTAVSVEGVLVVLVGTGRVTDGWKWHALVDLAAGSACPAAPDGCH